MDIKKAFERTFDPKFEKLLSDVENGIKSPQAIIDYVPDNDNLVTVNQYVRSFHITKKIALEALDNYK